MPLYLERRDPSENVFRFYRLDQDADLFGASCVTRSWGRIGTRGRQRIDAFENPDSAARELARIAQAKQRRGYTEVAGSR